MSAASENPNLRRRAGPGLLVRCGAVLLWPWLWLFRLSPGGKGPLTVFQSYMVGDLFMALPAIKALAAELQVRVVCRPDCVELLRAEGLEALPFDNAFFVRPGLGSFFKTFGAAFSLRGQLHALALDFDADPRTAFWLRVAGLVRVISYARPYALFFDTRLPAPDSVHQAEKNLAVAESFLQALKKKWSLRRRLAKAGGFSAAVVPPPSPLLDPSQGPWILSCTTRKDTKNWPLDRWSELLERLSAERLPLLILDPPDADAAFRAFRERWSAKVGFLRGPLALVSGTVRGAAGVITVDNFLGHMAAYYGKPVLWINGSSDPAHVMPRGPRTRGVQVDPMPCRPCGHRCVNRNYKECLTELRVEEAWRAFGELRAG